MAKNFPSDETEFRQCWSSKTGELYGLTQAVTETERRASASFVRGHDQVANALRDLARVLTLLKDQCSARVQGFIDENRRRGLEKTRPLRH